MSENVHDHTLVNALQDQLASLTSQLDALIANSNNSPNTYMVPKEPIYEITPDEAILLHYPAMDGKDFYKHKTGDHAADMVYSTEMAKEMQAFAKNTTMSYTAPKPSALDWPDSKSHHAATDKLLKQYQAHLANLTRPLDQFATEMFT
ncbi:hypothetical protein BGX20_007674, partial [Mortierella sp. AD010]